MMKVKPVKLGKTERMSFSHIDEVISMPNLIEVQKNSYQWFLDEGLKERHRQKLQFHVLTIPPSVCRMPEHLAQRR